MSPDGSFLVTAGDDELGRIWDPETGAQTRILSGHSETIVSCAISPDESVIVTGDKDEMLRVWDAKSGQELAARRHAVPPQGRWPIDACCFSPDGSFFLVALTARAEKHLGRIEQWSRPGWVWRQAFDAELAEAKWTVDGYVCAIGPDGSWMVSGRDSRGLTIWDLTTGHELYALPCQRTIRHCAISPDGAFIVAAESSWEDLGMFVAHHLPGHIYRDHHILLWETTTKHLRLDLTFPARFIVGCAITPDGSSIIAANNDGILKLWDASSGSLRATFTWLETLLCFALHPWKPLVLGGGPGGAYYSLSLETVPYSPIIVTACADDDGVLRIHCPACRRTQAIGEAQLGSIITCPQLDCLGQMRVNPFIMGVMRS